MHLPKFISYLLEIPVNSTLRMKLNCTNVKTGQHNTSGASALLLFLDFKFVTICNKNTEDASIWNVSFPILHNTHYKLPPHLSNKLTIIHN